MNQSQHLDFNLLQGYIDNLGNTIVQQMLDLYIGQSAIYLDDIANTVTAEHQKIWQENCHKMKGAAGSVGLLQVHRKLVSIEKSEEQAETKQLHVKELIELNSNAFNEFKAWLSVK